MPNQRLARRSLALVLMAGLMSCGDDAAPSPITLGTFPVHWGGPGVTCNGYTANFFDVPGRGTLRVTARWSPASYNFDLLVNTRPGHQLVVSNTNPNDGGVASVETPVTAQQYDYELRYVSGCPESATGTVEVVFTPSR
jgi:hypothetical protein